MGNNHLMTKALYSFRCINDFLVEVKMAAVLLALSDLTSIKNINSFTV